MGAARAAGARVLRGASRPTANKMTLGSRPRPLRALVIRADAEAEAAVAEADSKQDALGNDEDMVAKVKARVLAKVAAKKAAKKKKLKEQGLLADDDDEEGDEFAPVAAVPGQAKPKAKKKKTRKYIKPDGTEVELEEEDEDEEDEECDGTAEQDVLVKREGDDSWTIVNWQLSKHNGRWLTDSLTIN